MSAARRLRALRDFYRDLAPDRSNPNAVVCERRVGR